MNTPTGGWEAFPPAINLDAIFIARGAQVDRFRHYLEHWVRKGEIVDSYARQAFSTPSPHYPLQGLLVFLCGQGGLGKTTLLKHFREVATKTHYPLIVSTIIDWDLISAEHGMLSNPSPGQSIDAIEYYKLLHWQLAWSLERNLADFRIYREALGTIEAAWQQVQEIFHSLRREEPINPLRWLGGEVLLQIVRWFASLENANSRISDIQIETQIREIVGRKAEIGLEHVEHLYARLKTMLSTQLNSYLDSALHLGLALGEDLRFFASDSPHLFFFDTCEKVNEADKWLRIVMNAAGGRVGWVLAGRDSLLDAPLHSKALYGYREIVSADHLLAMNFNDTEEKYPSAHSSSLVHTSSSDFIALFSLDDIIQYFAQMYAQMPALPIIRTRDAKRIQQATLGLPLAVRIAADLYMRKPDLRFITRGMKGGQGMERMVRRYLRYALDAPNEQAQIYGLALLRRTDEPEVILEILNISARDADDYNGVLYHLQRRYSFILSSGKQLRLYEEVRYFLRLWLQEHRREPLPGRVISQLRKVQLEQLTRREKRLAYSSLRQRFEDSEWVETYLDLLDAQFWFNPVEGVRSGLAFLFAASIYRRHAHAEVSALGAFFMASAPEQYRNWWNLGVHCLRNSNSRDPSSESTAQLEKLVQLVRDQSAFFCEPLAVWRSELEAALWWRLGEAYRDRDEVTALGWYQQALSRLGTEGTLRDDLARLYAWLANQLYETGQYRESIAYLDEALIVKYNYADAYYNRGNAYFALKEFQQAIVDYQYALMLDAHHERAYMNLGNAYFARKKYRRAIAEYDKALALNIPDAHAVVLYNRANAYAALEEYYNALADFDDALSLQPSFALAYMNRGNIHGLQQDYQKAIEDYNHAVELEPANISIVWMATWANFSKQPIDKKMATKLDAIVALDPQHYIASICRGIVVALRHGDFEKTRIEMEQAIALEPEQWDSYFWKGMTCAYQERDDEAMQALEKALQKGLPPLLLVPLYWLSGRRPGFFLVYARPLLKRFHL